MNTIQQISVALVLLTPALEEVLLEVLKHDLADWRACINREFAGKRWRPKAFSRHWMDLLLQRERILRLFTILHTTPEKSSSVEKLTAFKAEALED